jgi:hypothetical protein
MPIGEDGETEMKSGEEVIHSSRSSSKSYLCTEAGQPYGLRDARPGGQSSMVMVITLWPGIYQGE